MLDRVT